MCLNLIIIAVFLAAVSGLAGVCLPRRSIWGQRIAVLMVSGSAILGLTGGALAFSVRSLPVLSLPWPAMGHSLVGVDSLSAFFLVPVFLMGGLGSIYGLGYWSQHHHIKMAATQLFWGLWLPGCRCWSAGTPGLSRWEVMALSAFFLGATEDHKQECRRAGDLSDCDTHRHINAVCDVRPVAMGNGEL